MTLDHALALSRRIARLYFFDGPLVDTDDLAQVGLVALWRRSPATANLAACVAYRAMVDELRIVYGRNAGHFRRPSEPVLSLDDPVPGADHVSYVDRLGFDEDFSGPSVDDLLASIIHDVDRAAVRLVADGYAMTEIGVTQGVSGSSVSLRVRRARRDMRAAGLVA